MITSSITEAIDCGVSIEMACEYYEADPVEIAKATAFTTLLCEGFEAQTASGLIPVSIFTLCGLECQLVPLDSNGEPILYVSTLYWRGIVRMEAKRSNDGLWLDDLDE